MGQSEGTDKTETILGVMGAPYCLCSSRMISDLWPRAEIQPSQASVNLASQSGNGPHSAPIVSVRNWMDDQDDEGDRAGDGGTITNIETKR